MVLYFPIYPVTYTMYAVPLFDEVCYWLHCQKQHTYSCCQHKLGAEDAVNLAQEACNNMKNNIAHYRYY